MMKMSVGRWLEICRPLFVPCRRFVGQPSQQTSEWSDIFSGIVVVLEGGFVQGAGHSNLLLGEVEGVSRILLEWLL